MGCMVFREMQDEVYGHPGSIYVTPLSPATMICGTS